MESSATHPGGLGESELAAILHAVVEVVRGVAAVEQPRPAAVAPLLLPPVAEHSQLAKLAARAGLSAVAIEALRVLAAAEVDRNTLRALQRLSADPTQPGVAIDGLVSALEGLGLRAGDVVDELQPHAPLAARGLVTYLAARGPVLTRRVTVSPRVVWLLRHGAVPPVSEGVPVRIEPVRAVVDLCAATLRGDSEHVATRLRAHFSAPGERSVWLVGPSGIGKRTLLAAVVAESRHVLACVDYRHIEDRPVDETVALLSRESLIADAVICIHDAVPRGEARAETLPSLFEALRRAGVPVAWTSTETPALAAFDVPPSVLVLGLPRDADRLVLWSTYLPEGSKDLPMLSARFRLPPGRIVHAGEAAVRAAETAGRPVATADLIHAVAVQVAQQVSDLGELIEESQTWDDVVLPEETLSRIAELIARVRHSYYVLEHWGFRRKMSKGLGMAALFSGPPGTGKTMVAGLIARDLGLRLYQIDLSRMTSKWVGETEKNLAKVFDAAEGADVMLLFDEADSLFGKRTEVKGSNDRYANAEVNYLLQRMERFEGISILTTNLEGSIDTAFKRRLAFRINFPIPEAAEREELWHRLLPREASVEPGVKFKKLASDFELSGGNIRNAVLRAAYLAASEGRAISMTDLEKAVRLEYTDAGRMSAAGRMH